MATIELELLKYFEMPWVGGGPRAVGRPCGSDVTVPIVNGGLGGVAFTLVEDQDAFPDDERHFS